MEVSGLEQPRSASIPVVVRASLRPYGREARAETQPQQVEKGRAKWGRTAGTMALEVSENLHHVCSRSPELFFKVSSRWHAASPVLQVPPDRKAPLPRLAGDI